jgi:copper resistance protein D
MIGDGSWRDAWAALPDVASTHAARALIGCLYFTVCLFVFSFFPASLAKTKGILIGLGLEAGLIACRAFYGHAAADGDFSLREGIQFLHLSSIAVWGGGILVAGLITIPRLASVAGVREVQQFGKHLSQTVTIALAIVILSGIYNAWKGLGGSLSPLPHSAWGRMLLLKLSLVLLALCHGVRVRFLLRSPSPWAPRQTTIMRRWVRAEALLMFLVLACSAWLANLPPGDMQQMQ